MRMNGKKIIISAIKMETAIDEGKNMTAGETMNEDDILKRNVTSEMQSFVK